MLLVVVHVVKINPLPFHLSLASEVCRLSPIVLDGLLEPSVLEGVLGSDPLLRIVDEDLAEKV